MGWLSLIYPTSPSLDGVVALSHTTTGLKMVSKIDGQYLGINLHSDEYNEIEHALAGKDFVMFPFRSKDDLSRIYKLQFEDEGMRMVVDDTDGKTKLLMKATDTLNDPNYHCNSHKGKLLEWLIMEEGQGVDKSIKFISYIEGYLQGYLQTTINDLRTIFIKRDKDIIYYKSSDERATIPLSLINIIT